MDSAERHTGIDVLLFDEWKPVLLCWAATGDLDQIEAHIVPSTGMAHIVGNDLVFILLFPCRRGAEHCRLTLSSIG